MTRRAFSLVELSVVLVILAVLGSILFPVFSQARETAKKAQCASNLSQLGIGLQLYARDYDGRIPGANTEWRCLVQGSYLKSSELFHCLADEAIPVAAAAGAPGISSYQFAPTAAMDGRPGRAVAADWEFRHSGGANVLFADGRVKMVRASDFQPFAKGVRTLPSGIPTPKDPAPTLDTPAGTSTESEELP